MGGFSSVTGDETIMFADNASFDGTQRGGKMTTNGQLWIGSTALAHVKLGTITSPLGTLTIGYSSPNITLDLVGGKQALETLSDDVGTIVLPFVNNIQLVGHVVEQGSTKFSTVVAGTNLLNLNPMSASRWIVDKLGFNGTHTTIATALTSATSGDTIFLLPGTYTENITLKAGVNLAAYEGDQTTPNVTIVGKLSFALAGTVTISDIRLTTNSDNFLAVTGSAASIVNLNRCFLNCSNNTGISFTTASTSAAVNINYCNGDIGTTGIALFVNSTTGAMGINYSNFTNSGGSSTASTSSAGSLNIGFSSFSNPITTSSTSGLVFNASTIGTAAQNATCLTAGGSGASRAGPAVFSSGSASAVSVGNNLVMSQCEVTSSNTNAVTGAGTLNYTPIQFTGTGVGVNTTTRNPLNFGTWTPTIVGTVAGTTTYTTQAGYFTIVGNAVLVEAIITITAATGTGTAIVGGLPFTIKNLANYFPIGTCQVAASGTWAYPASNTTTFLRGIANSTTANIGTAGSTVVNSLQMTNGAASFVLSMWYQI